MAGKDYKLDLLRGCPLFRGLSKKDLELVRRLADEIDVPAGKVLIKQGASGHEFFIVIEGALGVERDGQVRIRTLGPGDFAGRDRPDRRRRPDGERHRRRRRAAAGRRAPRVLLAPRGVPEHPDPGPPGAGPPRPGFRPERHPLAVHGPGCPRPVRVPAGSSRSQLTPR